MAQSRSRLLLGESLQKGSFLTSKNGSFKLGFSNAGLTTSMVTANFEITVWSYALPDTVTWQQLTLKSDGVLQAQGVKGAFAANIDLYDAKKAVGNNGAFELQDDGNGVLYSASSKASLWDTGSATGAFRK
jgi:hypothetical protein